MGAAQGASSRTKAGAFQVQLPREYIRFAIVDYNGKELHKLVPARHRGDRVFMYSGALSMGANSEVLVFPQEVLDAGFPNWQLLPDWSTEQVLPWASSEDVTVRRVYCAHRGAPTPRGICSRLLAELAEAEVESCRGPAGLEVLSASEFEFMAAKKDEKGAWQPLFDGVDIFGTLQNTKAAELCYEIESNMQAVGVDVKTMNAEYGHGQLEITYAPKFGIAAGDAAATFKLGVKEMAQKRGLAATFMSRPFGDMSVGNGGHFNFSLWTPNSESRDADGTGGFNTAGKTSAMHSASDRQGLSKIAKHFLAGVLAHGRALEALCAPTPACYTRHGNWAPVAANWGLDDRTCMVRVKSDPEGQARNCQMELRAPSASACTYLVLAGLVAAGLDGIHKESELPPEKQPDAAKLPTSLEEALQALEADAYMVEKLGQDFVSWYCLVKRGEMKHIDDKMAAASTSGDREKHDLQASVWQHLYFEFL